MSDPLELIDCLIGNPRFDEDGTRTVGRFSCRRCAADVANSGGIAGSLDVETKVDQVDQDLGVTLWLHVAAHHSKAKDRPLIACDHGGDDGVEWTLAGIKSIVVIAIERKQRATILQSESRIRGDHLTAESVVNTLNQRTTVSILIDDRKINGVPGDQFWVAGGHVLKYLVMANPGSLLGGVLFGD